jgi:subtilisin family serine protease
VSAVPALLVQSAAGGGIEAREGAGSTGATWAEAYDAVRSPAVDWAAPEAVIGPDHPLAPLKSPAPPPEDPLWSGRQVRAPEAQGLLAAAAEAPWVGHADTGWGEHYQLPVARLDLAGALDAFTGRPDATDPVQRVDVFDGHGTGTAAIVLSGLDDHLAVGDGVPDTVHGICPGARLTPVRCATSVVLFSDVALARAIDHLAGLGVGVITISLGGLPSALLRDALQRAVYERGVIVVAAGGQKFPIVPYPAAYADCIAVAASAPGDVPWPSTTGGGAIDIAAPGHQVEVADFVDGRVGIVRSGSGTSYATPHVAGAAALWLSYHGRSRLLERYTGAQPLQDVFRAALAGSARIPARGWRRDRFGAGILDIEALLRLPLPGRAGGAGGGVARRARLTPAQHDLAALADVLAVSPAEAAAVVRKRVGVTPAELPVAVSEVLRSILGSPPETVAALRTMRGPSLAAALPAAIAPQASPHLADRLG